MLANVKSLGTRLRTPISGLQVTPNWGRMFCIAAFGDLPRGAMFSSVAFRQANECHQILDGHALFHCCLGHP